MSDAFHVLLMVTSQCLVVMSRAVPQSTSPTRSHMDSASPTRPHTDSSNVMVVRSVISCHSSVGRRTV